MKTASSDKGKWLPMEERDSSTGSQASEQGQKYDVFLSHSGKQKDFIRQLHRDLTNRGVSCFFDQDRDCLPLAQPFPPHIFKAVNTCQVAVLLLSKDFLESKWPMLELSKCVEVRDKKRTNPNLKMLPLFFLISPDSLKNKKENDEKWQMLEISAEERDEWQEALKAISPINGLRFRGDSEVEFREEIVKQIWNMIDSPRYHVRGMQGEARMCQEVEDFFGGLQPQERGVRIGGLHGSAGYGKTTLCKAFCNYCMGKFEGKVCYLELRSGTRFERTKLALVHLTDFPPSSVETLIEKDKAELLLDGRVEGKNVLLVLDNITVENEEEVRFYLEAKFGGNSWILLSALTRDHLQKYTQSCMCVPSLTEKEAVKIFSERAFAVESSLKEEKIYSAFNRAKRFFFKDGYRPLALKALGRYLFTKYDLDTEKWVGGIDAMGDRPVHGLDELFSVLGKSFDDMPAKYRTIFMLLTVYILPSMSRHKIIEWMAIICNEKKPFIENALQDLLEKAFIEESEPAFRIHDLYIAFAKQKADKMERWLSWKEDLEYDPRGLISDDKDGFELARLEHCKYETIGADYLRNLLVLQLVNVGGMRTVDFEPMKKLRSITLWDCESLETVKGMETLHDLAWLQIKGVHPMFKLPDISKFGRLQLLEIDIAGSQVSCELGDLSNCYRLREIYFVCPSLTEFPRLQSMKYLKKVEFSLCDKAKGPLDCTDCVRLQAIVLSNCCQMAASPLLAGCEKLENLQLWNMGELMDPPSFKGLSNLSVLKLVKCGIREPPDLAGCGKLEAVYFFSLKYLKTFPNFSLLRELKTLSLCDCISVENPPDIAGCHELEVFHLLYNDNMKGLPKMEECAQLEEIQVSWRSVEEVSYEGVDPDSCEVNEEIECYLQCWTHDKSGKIGNVRMPDELKNVRCGEDRRILLNRYFRRGRLYYSLKSPALLQRTVLKVRMENEKMKRKALRVLAGVEGVDSLAVDTKENKITIIGESDPESLIKRLRKSGFGHIDLEKKNDALKDLEELVKKTRREKRKIQETPKAEYIYPPYAHTAHDY